MSRGGIAFSSRRCLRWLQVVMRHHLSHWLALLVVAAAPAGYAHDPFEITSRAYLYSNRLELRIEMEFPAAMLLANQGGARLDGSVPAEQFAIALPTLQSRAADFLHISSAGGRLPVGSTNVSLGAENHVRFVMTLPATEGRGLKFEVGDLKALSEHGQYGTSLTVVDMVHNEVLGQSVLFGDSPPLELAAATATTELSSSPPAVVHIAATNLMFSTAEPASVSSPLIPRSVVWLLLLVSAGIVSVVLVLRSRKRC